MRNLIDTEELQKTLDDLQNQITELYKIIKPTHDAMDDFVEDMKSDIKQGCPNCGIWTVPNIPGGFNEHFQCPECEKISLRDDWLSFSPKANSRMDSLKKEFLEFKTDIINGMTDYSENDGFVDDSVVSDKELENLMKLKLKVIIDDNN